jgi:starch phosphorylase
VKIQPYLVAFNLPEKLRPLQDLSMNMWFSWNWEAVELFISLDPEVWEKSYSNPVLALSRLSQDKLEKAASDKQFLSRLNAVHKKLTDYLSRPTWFSKAHGQTNGPAIAYFSMEFGIHEGLPIYSGGLGILAGDHLKSASDLGVPLVGVGLLYQRGYFQQYLSRDGWQQERYPENDWFNMPVSLERKADGQPVTVEVNLAGSLVRAQVWRVQVGRVALYLLDTNLAENPPEHRAITGNLYGGDRDMRIRQEIVLGIGGVRALKALGLNPTVYHMNEGHAAFLALERARSLVAEGGLSWAQAREAVWASTVYTTHTPVPAGHEVFEPDLVRHYLGGMAGAMGLSWEQFLALGQDGPNSGFSLTVLALRMAALCNGVARLHGVVSREMFRHLWPSLPLQEVPITHITNGAHARSWLSHDHGDLLEKFAAQALADQPPDQKSWDKIYSIPDEDLWELRKLRKKKLVGVVRKRLVKQLQEGSADANSIKAASRVLDPDVLTIGFARRFAAYKRATLLLRDPERLVRLLTNPQKPLQLLFAGKSHPNDNAGKELIKALVHFSQDPRVQGKVIFLADYDMQLARYLVQGVDVWLNNPRRPLEASGTSGMKAALNGAINVSTLDGWWDEGYKPQVGWAIGNGETYADAGAGDYVESEALYNLLEQEVVPLYYRRPDSGLPVEWLKMVKESMATLGAQFNTHRMVVEYTERAYLPALEAGKKLFADGAKISKELADWRDRVERSWPGVQLKSVAARPNGELKAGERLPVTVAASLGGLKPQDVAVEIYYGPLNAKGEIEDGSLVPMAPDGSGGPEVHYHADIPLRSSGRHGYSVRIRPSHPNLVHPYTPLRLTWEN